MQSQFLFVIGVEKCGTTSLFRAMQSLPQFNLTKKKEAGFFRSQYDKGMAHFESLFRDSFGGTAYNTDITPLYHRFPAVMRRLQQFKADKKVLVMLRNPVQRAFSHYTHDIINHVTRGERSNDFRETRVFSFLDLWESKASYFLRYEPIVRDAFQRFGRRNCYILFFENMVNGWEREAPAWMPSSGSRNPYSRQSHSPMRIGSRACLMCSPSAGSTMAHTGWPARPKVPSPFWRAWPTRRFATP